MLNVRGIPFSTLKLHMYIVSTKGEKYELKIVSRPTYIWGMVKPNFSKRAKWNAWLTMCFIVLIKMTRKYLTNGIIQ